MSNQAEIDLLDRILREGETLDIDDKRCPGSALRAFAGMKLSLTMNRSRTLSVPQKKWVQDVAEKLFGEIDYANEYSEGKVPDGRPVETPAMLRPENLPKKPPGRR